MTAMKSATTTVLDEDRLYLAYDRFVCATVECAGETAASTGTTDEGNCVQPVTRDDVREILALTEPQDAAYPLQCDCGRVVVRHPDDVSDSGK